MSIQAPGSSSSRETTMHTHTRTHKIPSTVSPALPHSRSDSFRPLQVAVGAWEVTRRLYHWTVNGVRSGSNAPSVKATGQCAHLGRPVKSSGRAHSSFSCLARLGTRGGARGGLSVPACGFGCGGCYNDYVKRRGPWVVEVWVELGDDGMTRDMSLRNVA